MALWEEGLLTLEDFFLLRHPESSEIHPTMFVDGGLIRHHDLNKAPRFVLVREHGEEGDTAKRLVQLLLAILQKDRSEKEGADRPLYCYTTFYDDSIDYTSPELLDELQDNPAWAQHGGIIAVDNMGEFSRFAVEKPGRYPLMMELRKRGFDFLGITSSPKLLRPAFVRRIDFYVECSLSGDGQGIVASWWDCWGAVTGEQKLFGGGWPPIKGTEDYTFTLVNDMSFAGYED